MRRSSQGSSLSIFPRRLVRWIDRQAAKNRGIYAFTQDPACILRLRRADARHSLDLPDGVIARGAPVVEIHLWNEHMPAMAQTGTGGVAFGSQFLRGFIHSCRAAAKALQSDPLLAGAQAVGCNLIFLYDPDNPDRVYQAGRLGFTYAPYNSPLGPFGDFWENLYSWSLMWAYNPESLTGRRFFRTRRSEIWMSRKVFLDRYG